MNRTVVNTGWATGGLTVAALAVGTTAAYPWLLIGDPSCSSASYSHPPLRRAPSPSRTVATSAAAVPTAKTATPWRDRTYLAHVAIETVPLPDDAVSKTGLLLESAQRGVGPLVVTATIATAIAPTCASGTVSCEHPRPTGIVSAAGYGE